MRAGAHPPLQCGCLWAAGCLRVEWSYLLLKWVASITQPYVLWIVMAQTGCSRAVRATARQSIRFFAHHVLAWIDVLSSNDNPTGSSQKTNEWVVSWVWALASCDMLRSCCGRWWASWLVAVFVIRAAFWLEWRLSIRFFTNYYRCRAGNSSVCLYEVCRHLVGLQITKLM